MTAFLAPVYAFFEAERRRPAWRGIGVVALVAAMPLVGNLVLFTRMPAGDQPVVALATRTGTIETSAFTLLSLILTAGTPVAFWLLYTGLAYGVTSAFDGEGSFARYATLFAWGLVPGLFVQIFWLGALVANATATAPPADPSGNAAWIESVQSGPAMAAVDVLYPVAALVAFGLWVVATKVGRRVTTRQAALAVLPALVVELATYYAFAIS